MLNLTNIENIFGPVSTKSIAYKTGFTRAAVHEMAAIHGIARGYNYDTRGWYVSERDARALIACLEDVA